MTVGAATKFNSSRIQVCSRFPTIYVVFLVRLQQTRIALKTTPIHMRG